jgi:hypothetical protein
MAIINRRNAVLGWLAWTAGKRVMRRKAKDAVPGIDPATKRPNKGAMVLSGLAAAGGAIMFWRRLRSGDTGGDAPL